jgi:formylglycine-generating enzyme required for sulfatase activity
VFCLAARPALAAPLPQGEPPAAAGDPSADPATAPLTNTVVTDPLRVLLPIVEYHNTPRSPWPAGNSTGQSVNVYLTWEFDNPALTDPTYTIYLEVGDETPDEVLVAGLTRTAYDPPTFEVNTKYYWLVEAVGSNGLRYTGHTWSFTTDAPFDPATNPGDVETMIPIPAGEFQMGCNAGSPELWRPCTDRDQPLHPVWLDAYAIDKYEVTNKQYRTCVEAGACNPPRKDESMRREDYFYNPEFDYYPVLYVSWWDALGYCEWQGKRLPTEAEWEKAARGAIDTRPLPWGPEEPDCSRAAFVIEWVDPSIACVRDSAQVGSYPRGASPYGALDMSANAFEWVWDNWDRLYYYSSPYMNPQGPDWSKDPESEPFFVIRGGSYYDRSHYITTHYRHFGHHGDCVGCDAPYYRNYRVGFRCGKSLP